MAKSIRIFYGKEHRLQGRVRLNFNWGIHPPITPLSVVQVTAAEAMDFNSATVLGPDGKGQQEFNYLLAETDVWVSNISPHAGGVEFILHVEADHPINVAVTMTVEDSTLQQFRVT